MLEKRLDYIMSLTSNTNCNHSFVRAKTWSFFGGILFKRMQLAVAEFFTVEVLYAQLGEKCSISDSFAATHGIDGLAADDIIRQISR